LALFDAKPYVVHPAVRRKLQHIVKKTSINVESAKSVFPIYYYRISNKFILSYLANVKDCGSANQTNQTKNRNKKNRN
jgi:hypothetical protein